MADLTPKLEENAATTLPSTSTVRKIIVPAGTGTFIFSSPSPFYWETPAAAKADGAAQDTARQLYCPAGMYSVKAPKSDGQTDIPGRLFESDTPYYFVATIAAQAFTVRCTRDR